MKDTAAHRSTTYWTTQCSTLQNNILQHTATHCITLQHTATAFAAWRTAAHAAGWRRGAAPAAASGAAADVTATGVCDITWTLCNYVFLRVAVCAVSQAYVISHDQRVAVRCSVSNRIKILYTTTQLIHWYAIYLIDMWRASLMCDTSHSCVCVTSDEQLMCLTTRIVYE